MAYKVSTTTDYGFNWIFQSESCFLKISINAKTLKMSKFKFIFTTCPYMYKIRKYLNKKDKKTNQQDFLSKQWLD